MKCPVDGNNLVLAQRHGIDVDYCPECGRMWLDHCESDGWAGQAGQLRSGMGANSRKNHHSRSRRSVERTIAAGVYRGGEFRGQGDRGRMRSLDVDDEVADLIRWGRRHHLAS